MTKAEAPKDVEKSARPSIVIVGMRGSGKSTTGKALADNLGFKFFDVDQVFVETKNISIKDFVTTGGGSWPEFRKIEAEIVEKLVKENPIDTVIATGKLS